MATKKRRQKKADRIDPTPGLRIIVTAVEGGVVLTTAKDYGRQGVRQAEADASHINRMLELEERRQQMAAKNRRDEDDVLVDIGDLSEATLTVLKNDAAYEDMVEDYLAGFNHIVLQGIRPLEAMYSMSQAFAIVMGGCLRANLPWAVAQETLKKIMSSASSYEKMVRVITDGRKLS